MEEQKSSVCDPSGRENEDASDDERVPITECGLSSESDTCPAKSDSICHLQASVIMNEICDVLLDSPNQISSESCPVHSSSTAWTAAGPHPEPQMNSVLAFPLEFTAVQTTEKSPKKIQTRLTVDICDRNSKCDQPSLYSAPKSPVTVQDWVDSIDLSSERTEHEPNEGGSCTKDIPGVSHELEDNLGLGAEALHLHVKKDEPKSNIRSDSLRKAFQLGRENSRSLNSETSTVSISSVEAFLETMRDDPEEILANLGFGSPVASPLARIPKRFLGPSQVKGNDLHNFIEKHEEMQELFDMGFSGYRGLSGVCMDGHSPSGIVSKILEKIRERNNELKRALTMTSSTASVTAATQPPTMSFFHAAFSVMAANAFRNAIKPGSSNNSILEPENRQFLDSQDEMMSNRRKKRPRLVLGKHSFTVDTDEELIDDNEDGSPTPRLELEHKQQVDDIKVQEQSNLNHPPLTHSMSDEVFLPTENKMSLWAVVRSTTKTSSGKTSEVEEDQSRSAAIEATPQSVLDLANTPESTVENEKPEEVVGQCHSSRLNRLTRQMNIQEEVHERSLSEQQQLRIRLKLDSMKSGPNKDSFELEELPAAGDFQDDDWQGSMDRKGLQTDCSDVPRTGSAMSDSSGFLDGETAMDIIDEVSMHITPLNTQMQALAESQEDAYTAITSEITEGEALDTCTTVQSNEVEGIVQEKAECANSSVILNCDAVGSTGYLSESDTIVAIESSSSGENQPTSREKDVTVLKQPNVRKTHFDHDGQRSNKRPPCLHFDSTSLAKSRSEVNLNVYKSPLSHRQTMGTSSLWTSLENISGCCIGAKMEAPKSSSRAGSDGRLHHFRNGNPENPYTAQIPRHSRDISTFHESCTLAIERMQDVLKLYTKQLKEMERSCWETHNRFFPGMTNEERNELRTLSDLRRHILEEVHRTQSLLCNRTECVNRSYVPSPTSLYQCNPLLIKISNQLEVLIKCQRDLHSHFLSIESNYATPNESSLEERPSQVKQMFDQMKREILQEVKTILENDHLKFQEELQKTRKGIEEVQETINQLVSIIQTVKPL